MFPSGKGKIDFHFDCDVLGRGDLEFYNHMMKEYISLYKIGAAVPGYIRNNTIIHDSDYEFIKMVSVPCGICSECLKSKARDWAIRIALESSLYDNNYFLTLTYDDEHLPLNGSLVKDEISKFNKKLKMYLKRNNLNEKFRFFAVGEYGSTTFRPHYHGIYFNLDLDDLQFYEKTSNGDYLFTSKFINNVWGKGNVLIGSVSYESACYVARYCDKKKSLTKMQRDEFYKKTGLLPEFNIMSRMPGIGSQFTNDFIDHIKEDKFFKPFVNGKSQNMPLYFTKKIKELLDSDDLEEYNKVKEFISDISRNSKIVKSEYANMNLEQYNNTLKKGVKEREF